MPITPLHLGIISPVQRYLPISVPAFILVNVLIDIPVLLNIYDSKVADIYRMSGSIAMHDTLTHTFLGALLLAVFVGIFKTKNKAWWAGCLVGSFSHVALDMFVHADVYPFAPLTQWNPFYFEEAHLWFNVVLALGLAYWLLTLRDRQKAARQTKPKD